MRKLLILTLMVCVTMTVTAQKKKKMLVPYLKGNLWGYSDTAGKIIIQPQFQAAGFFKEENKMYYAEGKINNKKVIITEDGKYVDDEFSNDEFSIMSMGMFDEGARIFFEEEKSDPNVKGYIYDKKKRSIILSDKYNTCCYFFNNDKGLFVHEKSTDLIGAIDPDGNVIIPFQYSRSVDPYGPKSEYIKTLKDNKYGIIDLKGQTLVEFKYDELDAVNHDGTHLLGAIGDGAYLIDIHGAFLFQGVLYFAKYANGLICCRHDGKYGYLNGDGKVVIPFKYIKATEFGKEPADWDFAYVTNQDGVSYFISKSGREYYSK